MPAIPKKKKKKPTLAQMRKRLDRLWFERIYERDKRVCQRCKRGDTLAAHHIFGKKAYPAGRWNLDNGVLLCYGCHIHFAHARPEEFRRWVIPWLVKKLNINIFPKSMKDKLLQEEQLYDWLFAHVQETHRFRACDFESKRKELEGK